MAAGKITEFYGDQSSNSYSGKIVEHSNLIGGGFKPSSTKNYYSFIIDTENVPKRGTL